MKRKRIEKADHEAILFQIGQLTRTIRENDGDYLAADKEGNWAGVSKSLKAGSKLWEERERLIRQMRGIS